ncbi:MAG: NAD(P)H-dependent flavin oxidoreductase [Acidimicrobiales bacterium]
MVWTPLAERIGIEHPFMQAGMGGIGPMTLAPLAAAISNAGALGTLAHPALLLEDPGRGDVDVEGQVEAVVEQVRGGIEAAVALTDRPLAINVRIAQEQPDAAHVIRAILDARQADERVRRQLRVITTSGGHPRTYGMNPDIRDSGMLHFHAVSNVRQARVAEGQGVDAVIATGFEAAGHVGHQPVHTFVLVPAIAEAVDIPVVCAGGVVDGRALAGALALGAELGYVGTRFLAAVECDYHDNMKRFIVERAETDTEVIPAFFGPARFLRNPTTAKVAELDRTGTPHIERMKVEGAALIRGAIEGDMDDGLMIGGQGAGRITAVLPAAEIVARIAAEAAEALDRVATFHRPRQAVPTAAR